ncbi:MULTISPECIES: thioredoxin domain-containing protein [unclassified Aeromicrobium]|uniref:DsbA family protein n=1 Tax=unclassified Aeromicrobium TaxID=2633570 RepID=UPI00288ADA8F|nr:MULTISPECIES: thioredoxin domain-containing protein [unclassified Aeromicrobium]
MTRQTKIAILFGLIAVALFGGAFVYQNLAGTEPADAAERQDITVRADSHRLDTADDGKVTLVEFLDFECEACRAAYPFVEQLREQYDGQVTFVLRYFPIPSHTNANNAAYAVESAARQGKLEDMYKRMYDTQAEWGESQDSKADLFRSYAQELGLDMAQYDADVASPDVAARVAKDVADGQRLGVTGTPSFFLNGEPLTPSTPGEFINAIDNALAK